jgi:signal transduction histidine kinase
LTHRRQISSAIAWRLSLFALIFLPLLMSLIWLLTNRAFSPVHRSAREVAGRSGSDLREIDEHGAPREMLPLLSALNRLFAHARADIDRERRFTADAAHELRTPLAAIRTHLQVLESARSEQEAAEAVRDLHAGIDRSSALIDQLLALAQVDAQSSAQALEHVALDHLIAAGVAAQAPAAARKNITLAAHTVPASVSADREMLALLLRNLLDNAIKYTPAGGEVRVSCSVDQERAKLTVIDDGIGIAPAQRARVFDRFFRAAASDATGSGLGLSIVQRIAEQHRARVMLADGLEGRGLSVSVEFPIEAVTEAGNSP